MVSSALPAVGDALHGTGNASSVTVFRDSGEGFEGGLYRRNHVCIDCLIRITITESQVTIIQNGVASTLSTGSWEIREFQGTFSYTPVGLGDIDFRIEGMGQVHAL